MITYFNVYESDSELSMAFDKCRIHLSFVNFGEKYCKEDGNFDTKCRITMIIYFIFGESDSERGWGDFGHVRDGRQAGAIVENGVENKLPPIWGPASGIYYHQYEQSYSMNRTESCIKRRLIHLKIW